MSLSTMLPNVSNSSPMNPVMNPANYMQNPFNPTQGQNPNQPIPIPGTRSAPPPVVPPHVQATVDTEMLGADDVDSQLATYDRNKQNGQDGNGNPKEDGQSNEDGGQEFQLPGADKYQGIAGILAGKLTIDPTQAQAALSGDANALIQLMQGFGQQLIQHTLHASVAAGSEFGKIHQSRQTQQIQRQVQDQQSHDAVVTAATRLNPALGSGVQGKLLANAVQELRQQYPGAPTDLLAKKAVAMFGGAPVKNPDQVPGSTINNWATEL